MLSVHGLAINHPANHDKDRKHAHCPLGRPEACRLCHIVASHRSGADPEVQAVLRHDQQGFLTGADRHADLKGHGLIVHADNAAPLRIHLLVHAGGGQRALAFLLCDMADHSSPPAFVQPFLRKIDIEQARFRGAGVQLAADKSAGTFKLVAKPSRCAGRAILEPLALEDSPRRLVEVFGIGKHSARVTSAEAAQLAGKPSALFERVYGLGNPKKAKELGSTKAGDGRAFRGNGIMQTTGRYNHRAMGQKAGLGALFEDDPGKVTAAEYALIPALVEWQKGGCNALADESDILGISRVINLGNAKSKAELNGMADRRAWFNRLWPAIRDGGFPPLREKPDAPTNEPAAPALTVTEIKRLQQSLSGLGYNPGWIDGIWGSRTRGALLAFKADDNMPLTDTVDATVWVALARAPHREVSEARAAVTARDLSAKGDEVVKAASGVRRLAVAIGAPAAVIGILDNVQDAAGYLSDLSGLLTNVPGWVMAGAVVAGAVGLYMLGGKVERAKVEAVRSGLDAGVA